MSPHDRMDISVSMVKALIAGQFPGWADLPVRPVSPGGWDNRTFRLGRDLSVRLPSAARYASMVQIEHEWLPRLAPHLPCPIPQPVAMGQPSEIYPWPWSIYRWIDGETAHGLEARHLKPFARDAARFLNALRKLDTSGGPMAGAQNFFRGAHPSVYDAETRAALARLADTVDVDAAEAVWRAALGSRWDRAPVWIHGDFSAGNILVNGTRLAAVIDFGTTGIGDPACDLVIAWIFLDQESRQTFKSEIDLDPATWTRARAWALWKALITLVPLKDRGDPKAFEQRRIIQEILNDASLSHDTAGA